MAGPIEPGDYCYAAKRNQDVPVTDAPMFESRVDDFSQIVFLSSTAIIGTRNLRRNFPVLDRGRQEVTLRISHTRAMLPHALRRFDRFGVRCRLKV
jgi:hypothetical protein